jgi:Fe2+ or Zn2+ uptake regulation protein
LRKRLKKDKFIYVKVFFIDTMTKKINKIIEIIINFKAQEKFNVNDIKNNYENKQKESIHKQNIYRYLDELEKRKFIRMVGFRPFTYSFNGNQKIKLNRILKNSI